MSKQKVIVLAVRDQGLTVTAAARRYGVSRRWVHELLRREAEGGIDAVEPRPKRPLSNPRRTTAETSSRILTLRTRLTAEGLDAGPVTIAWHLEREGLQPPSTSTIRRILHTAGLITPEPKKRPKASLHRFEAHQPNETWQSDFTHWALADGTDTEILNFLDDHSRYLLACTAPWTDAHPAAAYAATPKAAPAGAKQGDHWHRRIDRVDQFGKLTLRHAGQLRHIGIGRAHARKNLLMLIHDADVTISDATTGEIIRELTIDPTRDYQPRESGL